jgi:hypothetical protein
MTEVAWLPASTDTRAIMAAMFNQFFRNASGVTTIPSAHPVTFPYRPYPETVTACGQLIVRRISDHQATNIHRIIHSQTRADAWRGSLGYQWGVAYSFMIHLVEREGEEKKQAIFPILYGPNTDLEAILAVSRNPMHAAAYRSLGVDESQMLIETFVWVDGAWTRW